METYTLLHPIYERQLEEHKGKLERGIRNDPRLYVPTTFEVMRRHALEESHSNVIAHLLENKKYGPLFLRSILNQLPDRSRSAVSAGPRHLEFKVFREVLVADNKRIDILVVAPTFYVAIENKFHSRIHKTAQGLTQTEFYRRELLRRYPNKPGVFILLDYKGEEMSENYETIDYEDILDSLVSVRTHFEEDVVFQEYIYLLRRLFNKMENFTVVDIEKQSSLVLYSRILMETSRWQSKTNW